MGTFYLKGNRQMVQGIPVNRLGGGGSGSGTVGPGTINEIAYFDTATTVNSLTTATYPSLTELSYVKGVTSAIQTQINGKVPTTRTLTINGTALDLSADRSWTITTGVSALAAIGATPNANGATISGSTLNLQPANASFGGVVTTAAQTFAGSKTFNDSMILAYTKSITFSDSTLGIYPTLSGSLELKGSSNQGGGLNLYAYNTGGMRLFDSAGNNPFGFSIPSSSRNSIVFGGDVNGSSYRSGGTSATVIERNAGDLIFYANTGLTSGYGTFTPTERMRVSTTGLSVMLGSSPTAYLHLGAGTASASTAPLKFTSGTNLTTAEAGAMEYNGTSLMFTPSSAVRHGLIMGNTTNSNVFSQYLKGATAFSTGTGNTLIGDSAGAALTSGLNNVLLGYVAGNTLTNGNNNQFIGAGAGQAVGAGTIYSTLIGTGAGGGSGSLDQVTFIGWLAGYSTYASYSQFIGSSAGYHATNATYSVFIGHGTGHTASSADHSVFVGVQAGDHATSAGYSEFIGTQAGYYATNASHGFFGGYQAGYGATGANNSVFIGQTAGRNATGAVESIFIGKGSGYNAVSTGVLGDYNTGLGTDTLKALTTGAGNIALGYKVGDTITTGSKNVAIGYDIDYQSNTTDGQLTIQNAIFGTGNTGTGTTASTGAIGIFVPAPSARLHLVAGETGANKAPLKFNTGSFNTTAEAGAVEFLAERFTVTPTSTARQAVSGVLFTQTADATVANTVTETALIGTGVAVGGGLTLPANFFVAGKTIRLFVRGFHSSTGNPNITLRVKLGGTTVMATATTPSGNGSNDGFVLFGDITCRTTGGTGTVFGQGQYLELHSGGITEGLVSTAAVTVDTTTALAVSATIEWGTADAGNTITSTNATLEVLN